MYGIARVVNPLLDKLFPPATSGADPLSVQIIAEPGRYFVEAAFAYCARIYTTRVDDDNTTVRHHYYIAQGVRGLFKDALLCGETFTPSPLVVGDGDDVGDGDGRPGETEELHPSAVHGPSGEGFDVVCADCRLPALVIGDWLVFDRMGAYILSIAARNSCLPIRYVIGGGGEGGEGGGGGG